MTKRLRGGLIAGLLLLATTAHGQCVGDCNGDGSVAISELITGVNIALGLRDTSLCPRFDANRDGRVTIDELVKAVTLALNGCPPVPAACGNGRIEPGEECDDGNTFGGDGCAANCTAETVRRLALHPARKLMSVQPASRPVALLLGGTLTIVTGRMRNEEVRNPAGEVVTRPGEIPIAVPARDVAFNPIVVPGLACACLWGIPAPGVFGAGNSGAGRIGCGEGGLADVSYIMVQDHDTDPGSPDNGAPRCLGGANDSAPCDPAQGTVNNPACGGNGICAGMPDDTECDDELVLPGGIVSRACREGGEDPRCNQPPNVHLGACHSPVRLERFGGRAPRGSALIANDTSLALLRDGGICSPVPDCALPDYGPDCLPCTFDDATLGAPQVVLWTTGTAEAAVFDANRSAGRVIGPQTSCGDGVCVTSVSGSVFDCDAILGDPDAPLSRGALVAAFPVLDAALIGDNVTTIRMPLSSPTVEVPPSPTPTSAARTPTPEGMATRTQVRTATPTPGPEPTGTEGCSGALSGGCG